MLIRHIQRTEFDQLMPQNAALERAMGQQMEWYSSESHGVLGSVGRAKRQPGWNYVILKRDKDGDFHVYKVMDHFLGSRSAKEDLFISMAQLAIEEPDLAIP